MASTDGQTPDYLIAQLVRNPFEFDFFRAVRLLESLQPHRPRIGYSLSPAQDPLRFVQNPSLEFATSTIEKVHHSPALGVPKLAVNFFGLFGPNGPLPQPLTEYARERHYLGDQTLVAFLNIFHHRLISFFYRAWSASQKTSDLDRPQDQRYAVYIGSFLGIGMDSLRARDAVPDFAKLYFAGRLACQARNAEGLEAIVRDFFRIPAEVETFVGRWMSVPPDSLCKLGDSPETGSLGLTTIVGSRIWECQLNFRIRLGPMSLRDYERMLPQGDSFKRLKHWIINYCGEEFAWDIQMVLNAGEVPATCLGRFGQLGWTTWLKGKAFTKDAEDLVLNPN